jgi:Leucine-rich repeat (LRR) protein
MLAYLYSPNNSQSRLCSPPSTGLEFSRLKTLALNQTLITWREVEILAPHLPQLEDLQLGSNKISQLGSVKGLDALKSINLENNLISDWNEIEKSGSLQKYVVFIHWNK